MSDKFEVNNERKLFDPNSIVMPLNKNAGQPKDSDIKIDFSSPKPKGEKSESNVNHLSRQQLIELRKNLEESIKLEKSIIIAINTIRNQIHKSDTLTRDQALALKKNLEDLERFKASLKMDEKELKQVNNMVPVEPKIESVEPKSIKPIKSNADKTITE